jgi:hypothetical protein
VAAAVGAGLPLMYMTGASSLWTENGVALLRWVNSSRSRNALISEAAL